ncbi:VanW family protein [Patescibacteria group bacterium]|nr:VanW family protein [Patescibacteria group bacterium]MBU1727710.1 VanW family protein [Patescibacteria group bacterium]
MLKHPPHKHLKKKRHFKKGEAEKKASKAKEPLPFFVAFGLSFFAFLLILLPILIGLVALGFFEAKYHDKFYPGVFVGGEKVGGKTYAEVFSYFEEKVEELKKNGFSVDFENLKGTKKKVVIPISTQGLTPDNSIEYFIINGWEKDLQKAYRWGHGINVFRSSIEQLTLLFTKKNFNFSSTLQKEAVDSLLEDELYGFLNKSTPAKFLSVNNKISVSREKIGEKINREEVIDVLKDKLSKFNMDPVTFRAYEDIPTITQEKLEPFLGFAEKIAKEVSLVFQYQKHKWNIKGTKLVIWLTVKGENEIGIDRIELEKYLTSTVSKFIENPPRNSRFEIQNGELVEVVSGKMGNVINTDKILEQIEKILSEERTSSSSEGRKIDILIETIETEPKITKDTIEKYQIKNLVGEMRTSFKGSSADREHNIKIGVAAVTGILIAPGEEFSTVDSIGHVSEKEGYVKELVIKENKTTKEFGGGLCQIATTLFRLALNAGLPITERVNHRFVVHYYDPPGLDATIYGPHPDLRFVNDTGGYLLLQARVEDKQVIMELYGRKDSRSVEISNPFLYNKIPAPSTKYVRSKDLPIGTTKCSETPHDGVTTNVLYTVNYPDGTFKEINFKSIYQPWQKVCLVGTAH